MLLEAKFVIFTFCDFPR